MIHYLFSLLLVPFLPMLEDPVLRHDEALKVVEQRLHPKDRAEQGLLAQAVLAAPEEQKSLPPITGRLFEWSTLAAQAKVDQTASPGGISADALRLTALIESGGQRVAILNDGQKDHVIGVGSYVLDTYRVVSFGSNQVVLAPIDGQSGGKPLQLNLMPGVLPRGY